MDEVVVKQVVSLNSAMNILVYLSMLPEFRGNLRKIRCYRRRVVYQMR